MHTQTTASRQLTPLRRPLSKGQRTGQRTAGAGKDAEKLGPLHTVAGVENGLGGRFRFSRKLKIGWSHDSAVPLLGIHPKALTSGSLRDLRAQVLLQRFRRCGQDVGASWNVRQQMMEKQNVVCTHGRLSCSFGEGQS